MIVEQIGKPSTAYINKYSAGRLEEVFAAIPGTETSGSFNTTFADCNQDGVDLLKKMLHWDPEERISINDALKHPYMKDLHFEDDEPTTNPVNPFDFDFELYDLDTSETKKLLYDEILLYHSSKAQSQYIANRKAHPKGMLHTIYGDYKEHR